MPLAVGIDIGTTNVKAALFDPAGPGVIARGEAGHRMSRPRPGWAEQEAGDWWAALQGALQPLRPRLGDAAAIAVSGQGSTFVLVDDAGRELAPAISWQDARAVAISEQLAERLARDLARAHGNAIGDAAEPKLVWLARERPALVRSSRRALTAAGWCTARLGGAAAINEGDAGSWLSWDRHERRWDPQIAGALGPGLEALLPPVSPLRSPLGEVSREAAEATGLRQGTPIVASTTDVAAAAIGAGAARIGQVHYSKGTGGFACAHVGPTRDPGRLLALPVGDGLTTQLCGATDALGAALDWCCTLLRCGRDDALELAARVAPGAAGVVALPWLQGAQHPVLDPYASGVVAGMTLATGPGELVRAVLEATARDLAGTLAIARELGAVELDQVVSSGAPTRSELWNRLDAAATGLPVIVAAGTDAAVGSALVAASAAGLVPDAIDAGAALRGAGTRFEPEPDLAAACARTSEAAGRLAQMVRPIFPALAQLRDPP